MDEAIEQGVSLAWPVTAEATGTRLDAIRIEHEALQRRVGGAVASVPLGLGGEVFGALCVERATGHPIGAAELAHLEQLMMLAVPALRWMHHGTQPWHRRAWRDLVRGWSALRQPSRRTTRRVLGGAGVVALFLAVAPLEHEIGGRARVEGAEQRVLVAPADGFVKTAHVRPGDRVKAGDALVDLLDGDLRLERERWTSQLAQHENAYAAAMAKSDRSAASTSMARISEAQAQLALVDEQLVRGRVTAPFDALVIQGDLSQSIGAPVRQGDTLMTLATTGRHRVIVEVDEVDIAHVQLGQAGRLALSSLPWDREDLVVERITPLAKAVDGRNVFEVEARLVAAHADLRPGLLGRANLVVGRMPPLWAWTRHALDRARVAWWSWLG
jgi:biotin carboxyl carrier protein